MSLRSASFTSRVLTVVASIVAVLGSAPLPAQHPVAPPKGEMGITGVLSEAEFKALHELTGEKAPPPKGTMVKEQELAAYLSLPKGEAPFPAVIVIHEWYGLNDHLKHWADRLAEDGYAALAVDLYGGKVATNSDTAMELMRGVDAAVATKTLLTWHRWLASDPRVKAKKRGSVGWCFGGAQSLNLALAAPDLDAAVIYYGRLVTDAERLKAIKAPLLGVFGDRDRGIPKASVDEFEKGLRAAGVRHAIHRYDADHAFANPSGARYDARSAADAWEKVRAFLAEHLKK